ncbi:hypothetical protein ACIBJC_05765 [Streptomyces sp. NPDC050509]|uniref:hypothetical protein n=1 Tax=Streptomyces sp. NPDC050509 TaxID=3365620 RepID=UPI0037A1CD12
MVGSGQRALALTTVALLADAAALVAHVAHVAHVARDASAQAPRSTPEKDE